jgi:hypothetical protein
VVFAHPCTLGQGEHDGAVEAPRGPEVDVLDGRRVTQFGCFQPGGEAPAVAGVGFLVDQQPDAVGEGELVVGARCRQLFGEAAGHGVEPEGFQFLYGLVGEHRL